MGMPRVSSALAEFPLESCNRMKNCDAVTLVMKSQKYFSHSPKNQAFPLSGEDSKNCVTANGSVPIE
jgi:hypothetical protein